MRESREICENALNAYKQTMDGIARIDNDIGRVSGHRLGNIDQKFEDELKVLKAQLEREKKAALSNAKQAGERLKRSQIELRYVLSELEEIEKNERKAVSMPLTHVDFAIGVGKAPALDTKKMEVIELPDEFIVCFPDRIDTVP